MSLPAYPAYKDSDVAWLGEVPEHWELKRLKHCFRLLTEKTNRRENPVALENVESWSGRFIKTETTYEGDGVAFERGDMLFGKLRPYLAKAYLTENDGEAIGDFHVLRPKEVTYSRFSQYQILNREFIDVVDGSTFGAKMPRVSWNFLGNMILTVPSFFEQQTITNFLDRETAKIDELIAEQQRLIELLKEKRQAVISHAVTKGLNPDAPMKDSGIEWLGEVPEHWEVMPLKRDLVFLTSGSRGWADHYSDDGAIFIRISNLTRDSIKLELSDIQRVAVPIGTEGERTRVRPGDIMFSITAYLGSVAVAHEKLEAAYVSQHVALARLGHRYLLPEWVGYVSLSIVGKTYLETQGYGGTKIQLSLDDVANLLMTVPSINEQSAITAFLDRETTKIDELINEAKKAIELLKERRTALISAAVTGKIDVRGLVADKLAVE
ncbi:restriction endonuclease subunit S [Nitrosomonas sp. sh817]|uniref:restriction endonuclease subunit S n=1 Tax=Nitrosomonas sp. sh817 TaxID=3070658 RepID=UPI0027DE0AD0|nr:restriction endonuclease subunit S [Nitrosomonas sp. sh817]WMJ08135.1 restriction endonuclease subunit S [Nitrosomonas sp. sh817]